MLCCHCLLSLCPQSLFSVEVVAPIDFLSRTFFVVIVVCAPELLDLSCQLSCAMFLIPVKSHVLLHSVLCTSSLSFSSLFSLCFLMLKKQGSEKKIVVMMCNIVKNCCFQQISCLFANFTILLGWRIFKLLSMRHMFHYLSASQQKY